MAQFRHLGFTFDGIYGPDLGYYIVNMDSSDENELGLKKNIVEEDNKNTTKTFYGVEYEEFTFRVDICKLDTTLTYRRALEMTEQDIKFINNWLMKPKDYKIFSSEQNRDVYYYAMFIDMTETWVGNKNYITLNMRLNAGFSYSAVAHNYCEVQNLLEDIEIYTHSTVDEYIYPDVQITVNGTGKNNTISITNETLGETMTLTNLPSGYVFTCYNEDMKHIVCHNDPTMNMRERFNKQWLRLLGDSKNVLTITGSCSIDIFYQNKIAIQH